MTDNLYIPMGTGDSGARPWPPANEPKFYNNNGLWLRAFPDPNNHNNHQDGNTTQVGWETLVMVRVTNKSQDVMKNVKVQACLFAPGFGAMTPSAKQTAFDLTPAIDILGQATVEIEVPPIWKPLDEDFKRTVPGGHFCIAANVYTTGVGGAPGEGKLLGADELFQPVDNGHHAQRNLILNDAPHTGGGGGTSSKVPTTQYPPPTSAMLYRVSTEHVTTKPSPGQLDVLAHHPRVLSTPDGLARGEVSLSTSRGPVPITVSTEPPAITLSSDATPGLDTLFSYAPDRPDRIDTDLVVDLPPDAPIGSLHTFDVALWTERGDLVGCPLRVMLLVTE
ncbi:hypothetical protein [Streptomyces sp. NPDC094032]|uniref:hypothetical protein n=1 Tax=Streptomyces sp. NPDC094032 TaxID=3155308 RepID=UPI00332F4B12